MEVCQWRCVNGGVSVENENGAWEQSDQSAECQASARDESSCLRGLPPNTEGRHWRRRDAPSSADAGAVL